MDKKQEAMNEDTICAIATAQGGALGIIRVSGPQAIPLTSSIFRPAQAGKRLEGARPRTLTFGHIMEDEDVVDEVLVSVFRAPHSYTGEDATEITCHGSPYILQRTLQLLIGHGARLAQPGEYTRRAFLHGKMDLSQAEAVADLIASTSAAQHRLAMNQMRGGFSRELGKLRDKLLHLTSLMELELDFSDHEELEFADRSELQALASQIEQLISRLTDSFATGNALKNGIPVAIIGETNAGKSTLLNALVGEERAIVSDIHGTTRDVIEDTVNIDGATFRFIDTAGIRQTHDTIESLGIERSFRAMSQAQIVILVCDITEPKTKAASKPSTSRSSPTSRTSKSSSSSTNATWPTLPASLLPPAPRSSPSPPSKASTSTASAPCWQNPLTCPASARPTLLSPTYATTKRSTAP